MTKEIDYSRVVKIHRYQLEMIQTDPEVYFNPQRLIKSAYFYGSKGELLVNNLQKESVHIALNPTAVFTSHDITLYLGDSVLDTILAVLDLSFTTPQTTVPPYIIISTHDDHFVFSNARKSFSKNSFALRWLSPQSPYRPWRDTILKEYLQKYTEPIRLKRTRFDNLLS